MYLTSQCGQQVRRRSTDRGRRLTVRGCLLQVGVMVNAAAIADPELAAALVTEPLLAALEAELASLTDAQPSKVSRIFTEPSQAIGGYCRAQVVQQESHSLSGTRHWVRHPQAAQRAPTAVRQTALVTMCFTESQAQEAALTFTMALLTASVMPLGAAILPLASRLRATIRAAFAVPLRVSTRVMHLKKYCSLVETHRLACLRVFQEFRPVCRRCRDMPGGCCVPACRRQCHGIRCSSLPPPRSPASWSGSMTSGRPPTSWPLRLGTSPA